MATSKIIASSDVTRLYKQAYKIEFNWSAIFPENTAKFLEIMSKASRCPISISAACLLPMTSALCGPECRIIGRGAHHSPLNLYTMAVCDPGGGKTSTFENVVAPVVEVIFEQKHFHLSIETYTTAGIHRHQADSGGYGLITSDEGHRLLAAINAKQNRSEAERALL